MRTGSKRTARIVAFCLTSAALAGCQTSENKPTVTAQAQQSVSPDIHRILTAGGLNAASPGSLQTAKMPPQVQQAVAALSGQPAPDPAAAALLAAQSGQPSVPTAASAPLAMVATEQPKPNSILPPMIAETPQVKRLGGKASAAKPQKATAVASAPAKGSQFDEAAKAVVAVQGVSGEPQVSAMRSYLPAPIFSQDPVVITGPGARPVRMIQAQPKVEQPAPAVTPVVEAKPEPASVPEVVKVRRF